MTDVVPYLIEDLTASGRTLTPIPASDKAFQEEWLQQLLDIHPSILPVHYLDEAYTPVVSLGREINSFVVLI